MTRLNDILDRSFSTLTKDENKDIKNSKHSPVYRKRGAEGFSPLFSFLFVYLNKTGRNMKLALQIICLLLGLTISPIVSNAQVKGIIDYAIIDEDNTVIGDTAIITVHLKFKSASTNADTPVFGNIFYRYQTDSMIALNGYMNQVETIENNNPGWEIVPIGGTFDTINFPCLPGQLRTGPVNVIIIWPSLFNPATPMTDSLEYAIPNVYVALSGLGNEYVEELGSTVYPNPAPAMQLVFINSKYSQAISRISILNAMGQVLNGKEFMDGEDSKGYVLPTDELRPGIYHIHIFYKDKKSEVVKFIKN